MLTIADFQAELPTLLALTCDLVAHETPSGELFALDQLRQVLQAHLVDCYARCTVFSDSGAGDTLLAEWGADTPGGVLLLCHYDTVHPLGTLAQQPIHLDGDRLYGPGSFDMKASITQALVALRCLHRAQQMPAYPVRLLLTPDEEVRSQSSRPHIERLAQQAAVTFVLEPGLADGGVKVWRKGVGDFTLQAHGRASHAGADHAAGANAIAEIAAQVLYLQSLTNYTTGTTVNCGVIQGGTASNVVPDLCKLQVDVRVLDTEAAATITAQILNCQPRNPAVQLTVQGGINRPPMPYTPAIRATYERAAQLAAELGLALPAGGTGGGSDANWVAALGRPVLCGLGPLGANAHAHNEYTLVSSLVPRTALLASLIANFFD
jgi:glutamate carboxypeptidase